MHRALTVTQTSDHIDLLYALSHSLYITHPSFSYASPTLLFIHTKGLNKGRYPFPITIFPKSPKTPKQRGEDPVIFSSPCAPSPTGFQSTENGQIWPSIPQNWSRDNRPPTLTCDSSRVTLIWVILPQKPWSWLEILWLVVVPWPPVQWNLVWMLHW